MSPHSPPERAPKPFNLLVILGPTASGKTRAGVQVCLARNGEIISADSRQVYRGMDIGTGKDLSEYQGVAHHLIDIRDPGREFSLFDFQRGFSAAFTAIRGRGRLPVLVGGTGLYLESVIGGYSLREVPPDPELRRELHSLGLEALTARLKAANPRLHNTTDLLDRERVIRAIEICESGGEESPPLSLPVLEPAVFGIRWPLQALRQRITRRLRERMDAGLLEEVKRLHASGVSLERLESFGLEYRYAAGHLKGEMNRNDMFQRLSSAIHQFAKRQETWFRRMERRGIPIHWVDGRRDPGGAILGVLVNAAPQADS